jgi:hypothetical protein
MSLRADPIHTITGQLRGVEELSGDKVRLTVRAKLTPEDEVAYKNNPRQGVIMGNQIYQCDVPIPEDSDDPYKTGEPITIQVFRGQPDNEE